MQLGLIGSLGVLALGSLALAQTAAQTSVPAPVGSYSIERPFADGGRVRLRLASGDYTVRAGASDRIVVRWDAGDDARVEDLKRVNVDVQVAGSMATIVTEGPITHREFTIELPSRCDVHLRMRAGEVRMTGIEGHKNIRMTAGELKIGVRAESLGSAHASVTFGDLDASALGISKSGIKRSLDWIGSGAYALDARLGAGDITLSERP
jgi:hypothetical protein